MKPRSWEHFQGLLLLSVNLADGSALTVETREVRNWPRLILPWGWGMESPEETGSMHEEGEVHMQPRKMRMLVGCLLPTDFRTANQALSMAHGWDTDISMLVPTARNLLATRSSAPE